MSEIVPGGDALVRMSPEELDSLLAKWEAEDARRSGSRSFASFVKMAWPCFEPSPLVWGWHMGAICEHLEEVARGGIKRLIINVPPRHTKSNLFAILWPAWTWLDRPQKQFLFLSYSSGLSIEHSVKCRIVIESPWYREQFAPQWKLRADQNVKHDFENTSRGPRRATSIDGSITGHGGDIVGIDDPLNAVDAQSKAKREEAKRVISQAVTTRLNDARTGAIVVVMQRLHEDDPTGYLLEQGGWEHLCLPAEFEGARRSVTYHDVGAGRAEFWRDPRKEEGELLFPERFPAEAIASAKRELGSDGYAGQFEQRPAPAGGLMFQRTWWRFWKPDGIAPDQRSARPTGCYEGEARPLPKLDGVHISVDANFKDKAGADPVAIHVIGWKGADRFLLHRVHGPFGFTKSVAAIRAARQLYRNAREVLIEAKANGDAIIETLRGEIPGIIPIEPEGGKEARAWSIQPQVEGGNCYLPDGAPWLDEVVSEFSSFPKGKHDDDVDAFSQSLIRLLEGDTTARKWLRAAL